MTKRHLDRKEISQRSNSDHDVLALLLQLQIRVAIRVEDHAGGVIGFADGVLGWVLGVLAHTIAKAVTDRLNIWECDQGIGLTDGLALAVDLHTCDLDINIDVSCVVAVECRADINDERHGSLIGSTERVSHLQGLLAELQIRVAIRVEDDAGGIVSLADGVLGWVLAVRAHTIAKAVTISLGVWEGHQGIGLTDGLALAVDLHACNLDINVNVSCTIAVECRADINDERHRSLVGSRETVSNLQGLLAELQIRVAIRVEDDAGGIVSLADGVLAWVLAVRAHTIAKAVTISLGVWEGHQGIGLTDGLA